MMVHGFSGRRVGIERIWERFSDGHHAAADGCLDDWDQRCRLLEAFSGGARLIGVGGLSGSMRDQATSSAGCIAPLRAFGGSGGRGRRNDQGVGHVVRDLPAGGADR